MGNLVQHKAGFTVISNVYFRDTSLSLKAKGMIGLLLSVDARTWRFSERGLTALSSDGRDSVRSALKELEGAGYLLREQVTDSDGRWGKTIYHVFEDPREKDQGFNLGYGSPRNSGSQQSAEIRRQEPLPENRTTTSAGPDTEPVDNSESLFATKSSEAVDIEHSPSSEPWLDFPTTGFPTADYPTSENPTDRVSMFL